jgi:hypothetical protein
MTRNLRTLLLMGATLASGGGPGCSSSSGARSSPSCQDSQYFRVQWDIDRGQGTLPLTCLEAASGAYAVELNTSTGDALPVKNFLSCDMSQVCSDGSPCYYYGETDPVPAGTSVVSGTLLSAGADVLTVEAPTSTVPNCEYAEAAFLFGLQ